MKKKKIIFVFIGQSTFVTKGIQILQKDYHVAPFNFGMGAKWKVPFRFFSQFFFLLFRLPAASLVVIQLGGFHSLLPALMSRLLGKPSLIIAAGTDCHSFPSIGYGNFQKKFLGLFTRWSFKMCTHISPKDESLWYSEYDYAEGNPSRQGIAAFLPGFSKPYSVIANGYDPEKFNRSAGGRTNTFITIAGGMDFPFQQKLKGIDLFLEAAKQFPDYQFAIVGVDSPSAFDNISKNVRLIPPAGHDEIVRYLGDSTFYLQLSMAEGFPNALCEAMLCECVPVGSNVFSIPAIIGNNGFILKHRDGEELHSLLNAAIKNGTREMGINARKSIAERFPIQLRDEKLRALAGRLIND